MTLTPTELRADLYRLLDRVIATGEPLLVRRGHATLRIGLAEPPPRSPPPSLRDDLIVGDPDDLVHMDWSGGWTGGRDL